MTSPLDVGGLETSDSAGGAVRATARVPEVVRVRDVDQGLNDMWRLRRLHLVLVALGGTFVSIAGTTAWLAARLVGRTSRKGRRLERHHG